MKSIKCKVDDLGRITLPIQYRRALSIEPHDKVDIEFQDNGIFVFKQTDKDVLKAKIEDVVFAVNCCYKIADEERDRLVEILNKLEEV